MKKKKMTGLITCEKKKAVANCDHLEIVKKDGRSDLIHDGG